VSASAKSTSVRAIDSIPVKIGDVIEWPRSRVKPLPNQPRIFFDPEALQDLAESMREDGQITPVPARQLPDNPDFDFELTDGERRWRALEMAGIPTIKIVVGETVSSARAFELGVIANFNHAEHTVLEQMLVVQRLRDESGRSVAQIARKMGRSVTHIYHLQDLLSLPDEVQKLLEPVPTKRGEYAPPLRSQTALELKGLSPDEAIQHAKHIVALKMNHNQAAAYLRAVKNKPVQRPAQNYNRMVGGLTTAEHWVGQALDIKPGEFRQMFGRRSPETVDQLVGRVAKLREQLESLEELIASAKDKQ
jgi:ParB/RepB/Spo0J family partition protein